MNKIDYVKDLSDYSIEHAIASSSDDKKRLLLKWTEQEGTAFYIYSGDRYLTENPQNWAKFNNLISAIEHYNEI